MRRMGQRTLFGMCLIIRFRSAPFGTICAVMVLMSIRPPAIASDRFYTKPGELRDGAATVKGGPW
jgi:hypothetical protein